MKIDPKKIFEDVTNGIEGLNKTQAHPVEKNLSSPLKDSVEEATRSKFFETEAYSSTAIKQPVPDDLQAAHRSALEKGFLKARMNEEEQHKKVTAQKSGRGSRVAHEKDDTRVKAEETKEGSNEKLKKEAGKVDGHVDWGKGYTIWNFDHTVKRLTTYGAVLVDNDRSGTLTGKGRVDAGYLRLRLFGMADWNKKKDVFELGLGLQHAFELIGVHYQFNHDAPKVTLAGRDTSLHRTLKADAYIGYIMEGGAVLNISPKDPMDSSYLQIGGEAFAGVAASISGSASIGKMFTAKATGQAYAGAGAKALVNVGFKDGELGVETGMGAALMLGAGYDVGLYVNFKEVSKLGKNIEENYQKEGFVYTATLGDEAMRSFKSNLGAFFRMPHDLMHNYQESDVPSESTERKGKELNEKKQREPAKPVA